MKAQFKFIYILCLAVLAGCKTGDDLYLSPNDPAEATLPTLLTAAEVNTMANVEGELARISSILVQHSVGITAQYTDMQNYRITEGDFDNSWEGLYTGTMNNAKILIKSAGTTSPYYAGIGKVIMAINMGIATDLWGDVPYSEAFRIDEGIRTPKLDTQEEVYKSIDALLGDAIADFAKSEADNLFVPGDDDVLFKGDVAKWTKASYTLRARYLHRTSSKVAGTEAKVLEYLSKGISSNAENLEAVHTATGGTQNQWGAFNNGRAGHLGASNLFVDRLSAKNDPRLAYFLSKNKDGVFIGGDITKETIASTISGLGPFFGVGENYPIVTYYEAKFIEAEVKQRQGANVAPVLNDAIKASVAYVTKGVESGDNIAIYTTASLSDIMTEKWVAMYNQSIEPYNDYRRTGIPVLTPRPEAVGAELSYIPKRYPFPKTTTLYNPNAKLIPMDVPVWWGK
ncbi:SusD/RagB family nutrient-binding outer membrane lipoprotein [Sphingobacterium spiritivorum]|uniref:SusD/RagB family nutrient-binding outer membrane lipoprotein n=1 Tax=Sphingobacterium spiritivorum TaxID=258 RepID=UPI00191A4D20|nr:SusD/RagB family nutrient-binding outer membrane lipoprotein [Sphingobacterium spiritivorum]QQT27342.1 SusD/RagB family nutrient-binding outer membrane lipoprotein [Sphingobacterium spiritivorum]